LIFVLGIISDDQLFQYVKFGIISAKIGLTYFSRSSGRNIKFGKSQAKTGF
jgi:hypothetical protein